MPVGLLSKRLIRTAVSRVTLFVCLVLAPLAHADHERSSAWIPMRDGKRLRADIYVPPGDGPWPTILIQTPYNKNAYRTSGLPLNTEDYAFVIVDWRGYWGSILAASPDATRGEDGYDTVEWVATQSWSDGKVGTWGASALGVAQFDTAREQPPHLAACVPIVSSFQMHYEQYFPGGVLRQEYVQFLDLYYGFGELLLAHPTYDAYWWLVERATDETRSINVPMFIQGGWFDLDTPNLIRSYQKLRERSAAAVRNDHRLMIGPWTHSGVDDAVQGELSFPEAEGDAERATLAWFDYWLRDLGEGIANPPIAYFDTGTHTWTRTNTWPPAGVLRAPLYLHGNGTLQLRPSSDSVSFSAFTYDPLDPSPTHGGNNLTIPAGPFDQRGVVESRNDILTYTTPVLAEDATLAGSIEAILFASSDQLDTDFMVRVTDVYPDGRSMLIADGARRGRLRDGYAVERLMEPGEIYEIVVPITETAITIKAGHHLRINITSSNFPRFNANANDGGPMYDRQQELTTATNRIYHDANHPSRLIIPVVK